jgi:mRNA interferase RelE/StbE
MPKENEAVLSEFRIFETSEFFKRLKKLGTDETSFLRKKLDSAVYPQLKAEPFWGVHIKKLRGYKPEVWRYRIGDFRLFYTVDKEEVIVYILTIDHRKDAYK